MIGSSLPLCYPQIGAPNLFCLRALDKICPLTKHIRLGVRAAFLSFFVALSCFRFEGESTLPPQAGNASRWAATTNTIVIT
jgi:hypothetical protein